MSRSSIRLVIDTNTLLRGLAKPDSASGRVLRAVEHRHALLLTNRRVVEEYRIILLDTVLLARFPALTPVSVEASIRALIYLSNDLGSVRTRFEFPRDRKDEKFLALAIAGKATHIITFDDDLLSLSEGRSDAAKRLRQRLPRLLIHSPSDFVRENEALIQLDSGEPC